MPRKIAHFIRNHVTAVKLPSRKPSYLPYCKLFSACNVARRALRCGHFRNKVESNRGLCFQMVPSAPKYKPSYALKNFRDYHKQVLEQNNNFGAYRKLEPSVAVT